MVQDVINVPEIAKKKLIQSISKSPNKMDELIVPLSELKDDYFTFEKIVKMLPNIPLVVIHQISNKQILSGIKILTKDINIYLNEDYTMFSNYKKKYILIEKNKITIQYHTRTDQVDFEYYNISKNIFKTFAKQKKFHLKMTTKTTSPCKKETEKAQKNIHTKHFFLFLTKHSSIRTS